MQVNIEFFRSSAFESELQATKALKNRKVGGTTYMRKNTMFLNYVSRRLDSKGNFTPPCPPHFGFPNHAGPFLVTLPKFFFSDPTGLSLLGK